MRGLLLKVDRGGLLGLTVGNCVGSGVCSCRDGWMRLGWKDTFFTLGTASCGFLGIVTLGVGVSALVERLVLNMSANCCSAPNCVLPNAKNGDAGSGF